MLRTPSEIEVGKIDPRGYNGAPQAMSRADKPKCRNKALAASNAVCIGAVICCLVAGPAITTKLGVAMSNARHTGALESSSSPQLPRCIAQSAFFKSLPKGFHWPDPADALSLRVLEEYGAIFVARGGVLLPPIVIFPDQNAVAHWQSNLSTEHAELAGVPVRLQSAAMRALMKAREEAFQAHVGISPRGPDAAQRSYDQTLELWRSRVNPGLQHWVDKGILSAAEAERIRTLPARQQVPEILELEKRGLYFSKDFSKSVLLSVAPPGASQHLSMLAFDVKEHDNPVVRLILEHHGWFQTVRSDLPHFTYLGVNKNLLPSLGLKMVRDGDRMFWIPDFACPPPANP
jgi:hypothetical protein